MKRFNLDKIMLSVADILTLIVAIMAVCVIGLAIGAFIAEALAAETLTVTVTVQEELTITDEDRIAFCADIGLLEHECQKKLIDPNELKAWLESR